MNEFAGLEENLKSFNKSVGMFLWEFSTVDISVKLRQFSTVCMPKYGSELITNAKGCASILSKVSVLHYYALKWYWDSLNILIITLHVTT